MSVPSPTSVEEILTLTDDEDESSIDQRYSLPLFSLFILSISVLNLDVIIYWRRQSRVRMKMIVQNNVKRIGKEKGREGR